MKLGESSTAYVAEFIGTYMLVFTVGCNVLTGSKIWLATSVACVLMVCVYCFGDVSGAHLNPAVSIANGLVGRKSWKEVGIYCGVQILAGLLAGFSYGLVLWEVFTLEPGKRTATESYNWLELGVTEMLYTCLLCFVALQVSPNVPLFIDQQTKTYNYVHGNQYYGIAVGFVFLAAVPGAGHLTSAGFCPLNPAIALGIDLSSMLQGFYWWICYTAFEVLGACLGAWLFKFTNVLDVHNCIEGVVKLRPRLIAEGFGSFFLVLTAGLNVIGGSNAPVFSIAAVLMVLIFALGNVSGGHFNPSVTLAVLLRGGGHIAPGDAGLYMTVQFLGGILGGITYAILEHGRTFPLNKGEGFGWSQVAVAEIVFTFVLCYVVLAVACVRQEKKLRQLFGFAIGSCVTAGGIAIGNISGGVLNPAVAFAVAFTSLFSGGNFWHSVPYMLFQFLGAALAAGVFVLTRPSEYGK